MSTPTDQQHQQPPAAESKPETVVTPPAVEADSFTEEADPILEAALAAEQEIAAAANPKPAEASENAPAAVTEGQTTDASVQTATTNQGEGVPPAQGGVMIPKARLDEVLAERDQLRNQVQYQTGVLTAQQQMLARGMALQGGSGATPNNQPGAAQPAAPSFDEQITQAESKKLELAEKFDNGEISQKEFTEQTVQLDRQIRNTVDQRHQAHVQAIAAQAAQRVDRSLVEADVGRAALDIQAKHPYVGEIDQHPNGGNIWKMIDAEAQQNLLQRGINAHDGTINSRIALMQEKAALTDRYGPTLTGKQLGGSNPPQTQTQPANNGLSPMAQARLDKLGVANSQPPTTSQIGVTADSNQISEADIERMSIDEIAALPESVKRRFVGI